MDTGLQGSTKEDASKIRVLTVFIA